MRRLALAAALMVAVPIAVASGDARLGGPDAEAATAEPFTFVVLPDTQAYTATSEFESLMGQQTRWIRDHRDDLDTAFVAQVGDLVESHPNEYMWQRASRHMKVLDDAGVPSSVLPGNHDMNVATGEATRFDQYFGPSRYLRNTWTPSTTRYGGYLGQDLYGEDPVDRGNKDSFSTFTAGGMDFLVLSLEYEAPDNALAWAQKVIDRNPGRRVIVATHGFVDTDNQRGSFTTRTDPGTNSAPEIWRKLIYPNCSIFMVVNGHWTSRQDPQQGEGRRTDANACGTPVHQLLSDYQHRPHGGDGWLRYYTFDPARSTITARTYSPYLQRYETDADSQFTLSYPMTASVDDEPAPAPRTVTYASFGEDWRYRFSDSAPASSWTALGYDATSWRKGRAPLGLGSWKPTTDISRSASSPRPAAAQLRHYVNLPDVSTLTSPRLTVRADDGVVVYVNGKEVGRANMPSGAVTWKTLASSTRSHADAMAQPYTFSVPAGTLRTGTNVIAAQLSSRSRSTADLTFDVSLTAVTR